MSAWLPDIVLGIIAVPLMFTGTYLLQKQRRYRDKIDMICGTILFVLGVLTMLVALFVPEAVMP